MSEKLTIVGAPIPSVSNLPEFAIQGQDQRLEGGKLPDPPQPPLGPIEQFKGDFVGTGFNTIFRPNSDPKLNSDNVLELNLTVESLSFPLTSLGQVPNRGLAPQTDITLNGTSYIQGVFDVGNPETGEATGKPQPIHFEPGLWMHVPESSNPKLEVSLCRMASIPHGTTINAQGIWSEINGPPPAFSPVDITPFPIGQPTQKIRFASQTVAQHAIARLPQDLTKFIAAGTITQGILDNPNLLLKRAIEGQDIAKTVIIQISTKPEHPFTNGGGTANIDFLQGSNLPASGPNASGAQVNATFWVETVRTKIHVPAGNKGDQHIIRVPPAHKGGQLGPDFAVRLPDNLAQPKDIVVTYPQIQYSQTVFLNFATLSWPHVSVATLVPKAPIPVPATALH